MPARIIITLFVRIEIEPWRTKTQIFMVVSATTFTTLCHNLFHDRKQRTPGDVLRRIPDGR
jgi:hypothetical protein